MQFGLMLNCPPSGSISAREDSLRLDGVVEHVRLAEELGFVAVWAFERHPARGDVPAPWPQELMSKIAAATRTIRIGHRLWPTDRWFNEPLRAAEQAAALDLLCGGRLEIDCTASAVPAAQAAEPDFQVAHRVSAWERALRSVLDAWRSPAFDLSGAFIDLPERAVIARPQQRPHPPLWMSVRDAAGWELASRLGVGIVAGEPPHTALRSRIDTYQDAVGRSRHSRIASDEIAVSTLVICAATGQHDFNVYEVEHWPSQRGGSSGGSVAGAPRRRTADDRKPLMDRRIRGRRVANTGLLIGDAERCIDVARTYAKLGVNRLLCHFPVRGGPDADIATAITRFSNDVIAAFG